MSLKPENQRILPALDRAHEEALRQGSITVLDSAGVAMLFTLAGILDSGQLKPELQIKYMAQLQAGLDKYGLSLFGRKEKPNIEVGDDPLEQIRDQKKESEFIWEDRTQITDFTNPDKPN